MSKWIKRHALPFGLVCASIGIFLLLLVFTLPTTSVSAASLAEKHNLTNADCLACHQKEGLTAKIGGQLIPLTINQDKFSASVHGEEKVNCVDCHTNITDFPHPEVIVRSPRDFSLEMYPTCQQCHTEQYQKVLDSVHQTALASGNNNAAVCTDCHNPHTQTRMTDKTSHKLLPDARLSIPEKCARCHSTIYATYKDSVHGTALTQGNPDVPTCTDCHGVHNIQNPTTNTFRNSTPFLCAKCHTDKSIMDKYHISTSVLNTYVSDFHGTTVKMFEENYPDQPTNKPVCTDCHGIHNIMKPDNPESGIALKKNLLIKCQQCHPDATAETFTDAWLSHYEPSPDAFPVVYYVNLFYKIFIPTVLGGMIFYVLTDVYRRFIAPRLNRKGASHK